MFAIIRIGSGQFQVCEGDTIDVPRIDGDEGSTLKITDVLLLNDDKTTSVGNPLIAGASVKTTITKQFKGKKIEVRRFKSKVRERRHIGFRPYLTKLTIEKIRS
ncbi:MAG: 50S ribosomal protein L21 [Patescibacteria group bacterium]